MTVENNSTPPSSDNSSETHNPGFSVSGDDYDVSSMMSMTQQTESENDGDATQDGGFDEPDTSTGGDVQEDNEDTEGAEFDSVEDDDSTDSDEADVSREDGEPTEKSSDSIVFKVGDKEVPVSKDAQVELKVNGKKETFTLQEALNQASGGVHVSRELNRVKDMETKLNNDRTEFQKATDQVNANAQALLEIKDPYELCEYICDLKGGDPDELLEQMVNSTVEHLEKYRNMTERERELERENRKYKRAERAREAEEKITQQKTQSSEKEAALVSSLEEEGFTKDDFFKTIEDLSEKTKNGEELGFDLDSIENPTEDDIIHYMVAKDLDDRVMSGLNELNPDLAEDLEFIGKLKQAIVRTESLGGKMSQPKVTSFIQEALKLDNKALAESLSKKAKDANSKKVNSRGQEDFDDEGPGSLEELADSMRNFGY